jgi:AcrR family transcriptional regulator
MTQNDTAVNILHAARDLFAEKGFRNISTRLIAKKAGVNEVTLFRHFGTKTALYEAIFEHFGTTSGVYASFERDSGKKPEEALADFGFSLYRFFNNNEPLVRMELREQSFLEGNIIPVPIIANRNKRILADYFLRCADIPETTAVSMAVSFLCTVWGLFMAQRIVLAFAPEPDVTVCINGMVKAMVQTLENNPRRQPDAAPSSTSPSQPLPRD